MYVICINTEFLMSSFIISSVIIIKQTVKYPYSCVTF